MKIKPLINVGISLGTFKQQTCLQQSIMLEEGYLTWYQSLDAGDDLGSTPYDP